MRKHTKAKVYYYAYVNGFEVFTSKPKRKPKRTWAELIPDIEQHRKTIRTQHKKEQSVIDRLFAAAKENENRTYEEHKKLVERQVERIQDMYRLRICPYSIFKEEPCGISY